MTLKPACEEAAWVKLHLLANGVEVAPSVHAASLPQGTAVRKYFYNNPIWQDLEGPIPQELRVLGLVVGLNCYGTSPWCLRSGEDGLLSLVNSTLGVSYPAETITDLRLFRKNLKAAPLVNLYGGAALAFFSPRTCYFFSDNTQCGFCSLAGTAGEAHELKGLLSEPDIREMVRATLESDAERIEQVMIVGGNMRDLDKGFLHHVALARAAAEELESGGRSSDVSVHIATMPPGDVTLIDQLSDIPNVHVMFNLEVWDPKRFNEVCPGKSRDYGRDGMLRALRRLRKAIGAYRAHSLLVTGLDTVDSTIEGIWALADMEVSPIINIYHSDRHSVLGLADRPSFGYLEEVASALQLLYETYPVRPYWKHCGRNAIDAEAQAGLFSSSPPTYFRGD